MNASQRQAVGWGLAAFVAMAVFPPWADKDGKVQYSFVLAQPDSSLDNRTMQYVAPQICGLRLAFQWFVLGVVCVGLFKLNKGASEAPRNAPAPACGPVPPPTPESC